MNSNLKNLTNLMNLIDMASKREIEGVDYMDDGDCITITVEYTGYYENLETGESGERSFEAVARIDYSMDGFTVSELKAGLIDEDGWDEPFFLDDFNEILAGKLEIK